jgi:hypothetical protein
MRANLIALAFVALLAALAVSCAGDRWTTPQPYGNESVLQVTRDPEGRAWLLNPLGMIAPCGWEHPAD